MSRVKLSHASSGSIGKWRKVLSSEYNFLAFQDAGGRRVLVRQSDDAVFYFGYIFRGACDIPLENAYTPLSFTIE